MWNTLSDSKQLSEIMHNSFTRPQLVFKHSTRCGISAHALDRLEQKIQLLEGIELHYLDLLNYRSVSNQIAEDWNVPHQSPQVILVQNGEIIYHASHSAIEANKIQEKVYFP